LWCLPITITPKGIAVDATPIERGGVMSVLGMEMRVMALEDVLVTKLLALSEHSLRYLPLLANARAFSVMLKGLGVLAEAKPTTGGHETRVRVLTPRGSAAASVG
jgi:hypothetical protein